MKKLEKSEIVPWMNRFNQFYDAVIRDVEINSEQNNIRFKVVIETNDSLSKTEWSHVSLHFEKCTSLSFVRSRKLNYDVLSNGLNLICLDGKWAVDFGDLFDLPASISEVEGSKFYVVSDSLSWSFVEC